MQRGFVKLGGMGMDDIFARLEYPAKLWWPPEHSEELMGVNKLRRFQNYKPYKHNALYKGWKYLNDAVAVTHVIPEE